MTPKTRGLYGFSKFIRTRFGHTLCENPRLNTRQNLGVSHANQGFGHIIESVPQSPESMQCEFPHMYFGTKLIVFQSHINSRQLVD